MHRSVTGSIQLHVVYLLTAVLCVASLAAIGVHAWRSRRVPGVWRFIALCAGSAAWAALVVAMAIAEPPLARLLLSVKYGAIGATSVATFLFIAGWTGRLTTLSMWHIAGLLTVPALGQVLSWQDGWGMIRTVSFATAYELTHIEAIDFGPAYWLFTGYLYALLLGCLLLLWQARQRSTVVARSQAAALLVCVAAPLVTNLTLITGLAPRAFDPMPLGLSLAGGALWWGAVRAQLFDLVPVARHRLVEALDDGVVILDADGRVLDANPRFFAVAGLSPAVAGGRLCENLDLTPPALREALLETVSAASPAVVGEPPRRQAVAGGGRWFDVRAFLVDRGGGVRPACVAVLHDVTERQRWQDEQQQLIEQLRAAMAQVHTLRGLLPICAECKQIRDADGVWHQLEAYIRDHSEAEFSHGMCPRCVARWYPELDGGQPS